MSIEAHAGHATAKVRADIDRTMTPSAADAVPHGVVDGHHAPPGVTGPPRHPELAAAR
jgi:ATP-dependent protease ClpP protease subunit